MNLEERVMQKIFKCYLSTSVEYHAGGYFIRKQAAYLIFNSESIVYFFERVEGLHPNDNKYELLIKELSYQSDILSYKVSSLSDNVLKLSNNDKQMKLMPSVFIENIVHESLTEILVDNINGNSQVFNYVYTIGKNE